MDPPVGETKKELKLTEYDTQKRILLVDDDSNFRLITHSVLSASAFTVDEAANHEEALEKARLQRPDLILLDAVMEGINGFDTCRQLRAQSNFADVPIIMTTGLGDIDSINHAFNSTLLN